MNDQERILLEHVYERSGGEGPGWLSEPGDEIACLAQKLERRGYLKDVYVGGCQRRVRATLTDKGREFLNKLK